MELLKNMLLGWWTDRRVFKTKTCYDPPDYRYELWIALLGIKNDPWIKSSPMPFGEKSLPCSRFSLLFKTFFLLLAVFTFHKDTQLHCRPIATLS